MREYTKTTQTAKLKEQPTDVYVFILACSLCGNFATPAQQRLHSNARAGNVCVGNACTGNVCAINTCAGNASAEIAVQAVLRRQQQWQP